MSRQAGACPARYYFQRNHHPEQLRTLVKALLALPGELVPPEAQQMFAHLLSIIAKTTNPQQLRVLAEALKAIPGELAATEAQKIFAHLFAVIADSPTDNSLAESLTFIPGKVKPQQLINALKGPTSIDALRSTLLKMLEQQAGQKFDGNLWKMVSWAQAEGFDVKSPPERPDK